MPLSSKDVDILTKSAEMISASKQKGVSPKERREVRRQASLMLQEAFGLDMPLAPSREEFEEFKWLKPSPTERLLKIEKELHQLGNEAGNYLFKDALTEFFSMGKDELLEIEKDTAAFMKTFRTNYLTKYGEVLLEEIVQFFDQEGLQLTPTIMHLRQGQFHSNTVYPLYTYLYDISSREGKQSMQSILQKYKITETDLKECCRIKKKKTYLTL